jgi:hypothetical protein
MGIGSRGRRTRLALVIGHLYQEGLHEVARVSDTDRREEQRRKIEQQYRDPALEYLEQSAGADVPSAEYVAALVAFYEGRYEETLQQADVRIVSSSRDAVAWRTFTATSGPPRETPRWTSP